MVGALQQPAGGQHDSAGFDQVGEAAQGFGRQVGDTGRPVERLRLAIGIAVQVGNQCLASVAVAVEKALVSAAAAQHFVAQPQHDRRVAARSRSDPKSIRPRRNIIGHGTYDDKASNTFMRPANMVRHVMRPGPAGRHAPVFRIEPAESHQNIRVVGDTVPAGRRPGHSFVAAQHMLQDDMGGAPVVVSRLVREAAKGTEGPADLAACIMKPAGARPAVGAGKDRRECPWPSRTRVSSSATRSRARSQPSGTMRSEPRSAPLDAARSRSHPSRANGWLIRVSA